MSVSNSQDWWGLHKTRSAGIASDTTVKREPTTPPTPLPSDQPTSFWESHLVYRDLTPGRPDVTPILGQAGQRDSERDWHDRSPQTRNKKVAAYLDHLRDHLNLELWNISTSDVATVTDAVHAAHPGDDDPVHGDLVRRVPVYTIAPWSFGPFGSPRPWTAPPDMKAVPPGTAGTHPVSMAVLDTGLPTDYATLHPDLRGAVAANPDYEKPAGPGHILRIDAGHGLFILDLIWRRVPSLPPVFMRRPVRDESNLTLGEHLIGLDLWEVVQAMGKGSRLIVNMSFASMTDDDKPGPGLLRELQWMCVQEYDVLVVAAAGNTAGTRPCFPAACGLPNVVSVGALQGPAEVACFSARGPWVNCWTKGVNVVAGYVDGVYPRGGGSTATFHGPHPYAQWSGTSFAAPRVAAAIARHAATMPQANLQAVWASLRQANQGCHPTWHNGARVVTEQGVIIDP